MNYQKNRKEVMMSKNIKQHDNKVNNEEIKEKEHTCQLWMP